MGAIPPTDLVLSTVNINDLKKEIIKYVKENIIKTFSFIFLLFGGLIFYIYYLDIQYLPELNLISSVQLLVFASLTGILLVLSTISMLIFPGIFWQKNIYGNETIANIWSDKLLRITVIFIIPIVLFYLSFFTYIGQRSGLINIKDKWMWIWIVSLNLLWIISLYVWGLFKPKIQNVPWKSFCINYFKCIGLSAYGSLVSILPILLLAFIFLDEYNGNLNSFVISYSLLTLYIIFSNIIVIGKPENVNSIYWFFTVGLISLLLVITFTNKAAIFSKAIMRTYKLGNIQASSIIE